jgi:hypothetical protein
VSLRPRPRATGAHRYRVSSVVSTNFQLPAVLRRDLAQRNLASLAVGSRSMGEKNAIVLIRCVYQRSRV